MHRCCILAVKHWFCFSSSWLACTAAVRESEGVCVCERGKKGGGWVGGTEAACASTRDLPHSRLPPLCSSSLLFSSLSPCYFSFIFFFLFSLIFSFQTASVFWIYLLVSYSPLRSLIPAVLPPFVPALQAEDDTSNFEEPEQAAPWPASANQQGALPAGFHGQDLPFLGWFFSRALTLLVKSE